MYRCDNPHASRNSVSPVHKIFLEMALLTHYIIKSEIAWTIAFMVVYPEVLMWLVKCRLYAIGNQIIEKKPQNIEVWTIIQIVLEKYFHFWWYHWCAPSFIQTVTGPTFSDKIYKTIYSHIIIYQGISNCQSPDFPIPTSTSSTIWIGSIFA